LGSFSHLFGSNAVLIDGAHSQSGHPIMWGAPQMGLFYPNIPYEVALHGAGYDAGGIGVTGTPGIVIGRTPTFAWSVTSGASDQSDIVAEPVIDWHARTYDHDGETLPRRDPPGLHAAEW
jgi:penicillin amidase